MKDVKNKTLVAANNEKVKTILTGLGINSDVTVTAAKAMVKGDVFTLTGVSKVGNGSKDGTFQPLAFTTNIGKTIGTKNFNDVEFDGDDYPKVGRTAEDAVRFLVWAMENEVTFTVEKVKTYDEKSLDDGTKYTPKDIKLSAE